MIALGLALLAAGCARPGWCVTPEEEKPFRDLLQEEQVVEWAFAAGKLPFAAAIVDCGAYGEYRVFARRGKEIITLVSGKLKPEQVQLSRCHFIMGGAHVMVVVREAYGESSLSSLFIYDATRGEATPVFSLPAVYDLRYEPAGATELLLWQKDDAFYNRGSPPYKYNYYLLAYDTVQNRYTFDFHLRTIVAPHEDEAVLLNNRAVQLYLEGDLKSAAAKLDDSLMLAQYDRSTIGANRRYIENERKTLALRSANPAGAAPALFDEVKLNYLLGEWDQVLLTIESGASRRTGDRVALFGLCYARKREYTDLQRMTKVLADNDYEHLTGYLEEVARILFYHRDFPLLRPYLKLLEERDPLNPTLAYLKAAVLAEAGRLELAASLLDSYLGRVDEKVRRLGECREYLYEIATVLGDTKTAQRMLARFNNDVIWDLTPLGRLANFAGFLHTEQVSAPAHVSSRIKVPEKPLEVFNPVEMGDGFPPDEGAGSS